MEIPAKTADILRPHRSSCEITCKELLQIYNPGQNLWDTLCFRPPLNSVGCYESNTFYIFGIR